ncbi:MAG TPA: penicillin-binding protein [Myxococcales bacterium]|nr:penicillin-binding protein [Myxococcales bacterium]
MHERGRSARGGSGRWVRVRSALVGVALLSGFGVVLARAAKVQLFDRARLARLARDQTRREIEWAPRRGPIADRRGAPLAVTRDVDSIFADPTAFTTARERGEAAGSLARALGTSRAKILARLAGEKRFVWLKRRVDEDTAARVAALSLDGVELVKEPKRFYPQRALSGHVLGFVGEEGGQEGLERELDASLRGKPVSVQAVRDARGATVLAQGAPDPADLTGATVTLTLDSAIQLAAERELQRAVASSRASAGWVAVVDVRSGAVLALASNPAFDANEPGRDPAVWRHRAVQDQLEPGSTIKSFVLAAALDKGAIDPQKPLYCENGVWERHGHRIHDTHKVAWATPSAVLRESSNICAAKIGEALGKERLMAALRAFGFGERTGVGLPGEARGTLPDPVRMPDIAVDTVSFGQGLSATGLQTVMAMAAIANGGLLLKPFIVSKVVAPGGKVLHQRQREEVRRVLRPATAREITAMLEEVVEKGTGMKARVNGFRVAGKTGTAQKVDPVRGGYGEKRLASFLGFLPADEPRLAILVAVDEPEGDVFGGSVAAPAWSAIAAEALRQIGVAPESSREEVALASIASAGAGDGEAYLDGDGGDAPDPQAAGGEPQGASRKPIEGRKPGRSVVPDLVGLPARSAVRKLAEAALEPELRGSGRTVAQSPRAGAIVKRGARVRVTLAPSG